MYVEIEKNVLPNDLMGASSIDPSRGQQLNRDEMQGPDEDCHDGIGVDNVLLREKFKLALGTLLLNNACEDTCNAGDNMEVGLLQWGAVSRKGKQSAYAHGIIGIRFVKMLSEPIELSNNARS